MDYKNLANLSTGSTPRVVDSKDVEEPEDIIGSVIDNRTQRRVSDSRKKPFVKVQLPISDSVLRAIMAGGRKEKREFLSKLSDSDRVRAIKRMNKLKDDESSERIKYGEMADAITEWVVSLDDNAKSKLEDFIDDESVPKDEKDCLERIIGLETSPADEIHEIYEPLISKFDSLGIDNPPFALLQDSKELKIPKGFAIIKDNKVYSINILGKTDKSVIYQIGDSEFLAPIDQILKDAKKVSDADLEYLFDKPEDGEPEDDEKPADKGDDTDDKGDDTEDDDDNEEPEEPEAEPEPEQSNHSQLENVISALDEFRETGNIDALSSIIDSPEVSENDEYQDVVDSFRAIKKVHDDLDNDEDKDGVSVDENTKDSLVDAFLKSLKDKGIEVPDSYSGKSFFSDAAVLPVLDYKETSPSAAVQMVMTRDSYLTTFAHINCNKVARLAKQNSQIMDFKTFNRENSVVSRGLKTQHLVSITDAAEIKDGEDLHKFVNDNFVTADSFRKAALQLGALEFVDKNLYKRHINDCGYTSCPCTSETMGDIVPVDVKESLPKNCTLIYIVSPESIVAPNNLESVTDEVPIVCDGVNFNLQVFKKKK